MSVEMLRPRNIVVIIAGALGTLGLASCGQMDPPSPQQVNAGAEYFQLDGVTDATGDSVRCVMYGSMSEGSQDSKSWFGFACDFTGTAKFPNEK